MSNLSHPPMSDEILSAYVDGELSAEESAAVAAACETDGSVATRVSDLRALSGLLQSMPRPTAPAGLFAVEEPVASKRPRRPAWARRALPMAAALGLAGVMAVLMLPGDPGVMDEAQNAGPMLAMESPGLKTQAGAVEAADPGVMESERAEIAAAAVPAAAATAVPVPAGGSVVADAVAMPSVFEAGAVEPLPETADLPRPGALISILQESPGEEAVVVNWVVADVDQSLGELRMLVQRLGVPESAIEEPERDGGRREGELLAVYVQADTPVIDAVMAEMKRRNASLERAADVMIAEAGSRKMRQKSEAFQLERTAPLLAQSRAKVESFAADNLSPAVENGYGQYEVLSDPAGQPYQQVLAVDESSMEAIVSNSAAVGVPAGGPGPVTKNRILIVIREKRADDARPM